MLGVVTAALLVANTVVANSLWEWSKEEYFWSMVVGPDKARAIYGMLKREFQGEVIIDEPELSHRCELTRR